MYFLPYVFTIFFQPLPISVEPASDFRVIPESYRAISEIDAMLPLYTIMFNIVQHCTTYYATHRLFQSPNGWNLRISCHYPGNSLYFLSISFQKGFPGIFPARAQYFLLPGNFLASGSSGSRLGEMNNLPCKRFTRETETRQAGRNFCQQRMRVCR